MQRSAQHRFILCATLAVGFAIGVCAKSAAQEVASIDLTQLTSRDELRRPPPTAGEVDGIHDGINDNHPCFDPKKNIGVLRTTLTRLDRTDYQLGDKPIINVTIENVGSEPLKVPVSPRLAVLQPADPALKLDFTRMTVVLWIGGKQWDASTGGVVSLYGSEGHQDTMLTLRPGEWVRVIGRGSIDLPLQDGGAAYLISPGDSVNHANAQTTIEQTSTLIAASAIASISRELCIDERQGPDVPITVAGDQHEATTK